MTPEEWQAVRLSVVVAISATVAVAPFATALGVLLARWRGWGRTLVESVAMAPLVLPPVVTGFLLLEVLGRRGPLGGPLAALGVSFTFETAGAALAAAVMAFPLFVRAVRLSVEGVDPGLEAAARTLGASRWRALLTVTLPLALPGVVAGALLAFARSLGEFGATIVFAGNVAGETRTLPLALFTALQQPGGEPLAWRLAAIALGLSLLALAASEVLAREVGRRVGREPA